MLNRRGPHKILEPELIPTQFALYQNFPDPFNPSTTIRYAIPKPCKVSLKIFNLLGELVAILVDQEQQQAYYEIRWGPQLPSGMYLYRLQAGDFVETKKLLLLK